jgi:hypothetical protein
MSYQDLFPRLQKASGNDHADYLAYLGRRYFREGSSA